MENAEKVDDKLSIIMDGLMLVFLHYLDTIK